MLSVECSMFAFHFKRAVPVAVVDVGWSNLDSVVDGVADDLGGGVETHGLAVEQGGAEDGGVMTLDPGAGVNEKREAGGMGFGETVFAEAADLFEDALGELSRITVGEHAVDDFGIEGVDDAVAPPGGHGAAQLV